MANNHATETDAVERWRWLFQQFEDACRQSREVRLRIRDLEEQVLREVPAGTYLVDGQALRVVPAEGRRRGRSPPVIERTGLGLYRWVGAPTVHSPNGKAAPTASPPYPGGGGRRP